MNEDQKDVMPGTPVPEGPQVPGTNMEQGDIPVPEVEPVDVPAQPAVEPVPEDSNVNADPMIPVGS